MTTTTLDTLTAPQLSALYAQATGGMPVRFNSKTNGRKRLAKAMADTGRDLGDLMRSVGMAGAPGFENNDESQDPADAPALVLSVEEIVAGASEDDRPVIKQPTHKRDQYGFVRRVRQPKPEPEVAAAKVAADKRKQLARSVADKINGKSSAGKTAPAGAPNKTSIFWGMVTAPGGATHEDLKAATGWPSFKSYLDRICPKRGATYGMAKEGKVVTYRVTVA
jgi:hypothetical protein